MDDKEYDTVVDFLETKIVPFNWSNEAIQFYSQHYYVADGKLCGIRSKLPIVRRGNLSQTILIAHITPDGQHCNKAETVQRLLKHYSLLNANTEVRLFIEKCQLCSNHQIQGSSNMHVEQPGHSLKELKSALDVFNSLKEENQQLSRTSDRQLTTSGRLRDNWDLRTKNVKMARLQDCSDTKKDLISQLKSDYGDRLTPELDTGSAHLSSAIGHSKGQLESLSETYEHQLRAKDVEISQLRKYIREKEEERSQADSGKASSASTEIAALQEDLTQAKAEWIAAEAHNNYIMSTMVQLQAKLQSAEEELASEVTQRENLNTDLHRCKDQLSATQTLLESRENDLTSVKEQFKNVKKKLSNCQCQKGQSVEVKKNSETLQLIASLESQLNAAKEEFCRLQVEFNSFKSEKDKLEQKVEAQQTEMAGKTAQHAQTIIQLHTERNIIITEYFAKINELKKELNKKNKDHHSALQLLESKSASLAIAEGHARKYEEALKYQEKTRMEVEKRLNETAAAFLAAQEELQKKLKELAEAQTIAESNKSQLCAAQEKIKSLMTEIAGAQTTIRKQNEAIDDLMNRTRTMHEALSEAKIECTDGYNRFKQLEAGFKQKEDELTKEQLYVQQKDATIANLERYVNAMQNNIRAEQPPQRSEFLQTNVAVVMKEKAQTEMVGIFELQPQSDYVAHSAQYPPSTSGRQPNFVETLKDLNSVLKEKDSEILQCKHEMATMDAVIRTKDRLLTVFQSSNIELNERLTQTGSSLTYTAPGNEQIILELQRRVYQLTNEVTDKEQRLNELRQTICAFTGDLQKTKDRLIAMETAYKEVESNLKYYQSALSEKQNINAGLNEKLTMAMQSVTKLGQSLSEANKSNCSLVLSVQNKEKIMLELEEKMYSMTAKAACKEQRIKELEDEAVMREEKLREVKQQMEAVTSSAEINANTASSLEQRLASVTIENGQRVLELNNKISSLTNEAEHRDGQILLLEAKLINAEAIKDNMQQKLTTNDRDVNELRAELKALREKHEKLQKSLAKGERDIQAFRSFQDVDQNLLKRQQAELKEFKRRLTRVKSRHSDEKMQQSEQIIKLKTLVNKLQDELKSRNRRK